MERESEDGARRSMRNQNYSSSYFLLCCINITEFDFSLSEEDFFNVFVLGFSGVRRQQNPFCEKKAQSVVNLQLQAEQEK